MNLPNGAVVDHVCAQIYDTHASNVIVEWGLYELGSAQADPTFVSISSDPNSYSAGYQIFCVPDIPHTVRSLDDFDGDGTRPSARIEFAVYLPPTDSTMRLGGAWLNYHLQVSPAPAVATFPVDVPTTHPFFRFIEALAAAGITAGTGPGDFRPMTP